MRGTLSATILVALLWCVDAQAALIERDWLAPGDGLLTYDNVNGREWLDIPESLLSQFGTDDDVDAAIDAALAETLPGGRFEGFALASREEFFELMESAGIDTTPPIFTDDMSALSMQRLIELLGPLSTNPGMIRTGGVVNGVIFDPPTPPLPARIAMLLSYTGFIGDSTPFGFGRAIEVSRGDGYTVNFLGLLLSRPAIPEPSTCTLVLSVTVTVVIQRSWLCGILNRKPLQGLSINTATVYFLAQVAPIDVATGVESAGGVGYVGERLGKPASKVRWFEVPSFANHQRLINVGLRDAGCRSLLANHLGKFSGLFASRRKQQ
jgi:hypothetical protein